MAGRLLWVVVFVSSGHAFVSERVESTFLDDITEVPSELFLQLEAEVSVTVVKADLAPQRLTGGWPAWADLIQRSSRLKTTVSGRQLLSFLEQVAKYLVSISYVAFLAICAYLCLRGLPSKTPQHSSVKGEGCSRRWCIYMGVVYMVIYASTDQYVPSLPKMEKDLEGSQVSMTATVQINWVVKALFGLLAAGLSDRIGRRPVALTCMFVLCMSTFCCACAGHVEWFVAARILQGMGESFEPVVYAMIRDYYSDPGRTWLVWWFSISPLFNPPFGGSFAFLGHKNTQVQGPQWAHQSKCILADHGFAWQLLCSLLRRPVCGIPGLASILLRFVLDLACPGIYSMRGDGGVLSWWKSWELLQGHLATLGFTSCMLARHWEPCHGRILYVQRQLQLSHRGHFP